MNDALVDRLIERHEGLRLKPYRDTVGKLTIGIGRNLDDVGISEAEALMLLDNDVARAMALLDANIPWWRKLDDVRQEVLIDMCLNMGWAQRDPATGVPVHGLATFSHTLAAIQAGRYAEAADGMLASGWAKQVHSRADELAAMMRTGQQPAALAGA